MSGPAADRIEQSKQIEGGSSIEGKIQQGLFIWAIRSMHRFEMTKVRLFFCKTIQFDHHHLSGRSRYLGSKFFK